MSERGLLGGAVLGYIMWFMWARLVIAVTT